MQFLQQKQRIVHQVKRSEHRMRASKIRNLCFWDLLKFGIYKALLHLLSTDGVQKVLNNATAICWPDKGLKGKYGVC